MEGTNKIFCLFFSEGIYLFTLPFLRAIFGVPSHQFPCTCIAVCINVNAGTGNVSGNMYDMHLKLREWGADSFCSGRE